MHDIEMTTYKSKNYKFQFLGPGAVRSPLGFEVRVTPSQLQYIEGESRGFLDGKSDG
jgi:hypothetical protein